MKTLAERCGDISLLVLDVDGVLTDGRITYTDADVEIKSFHVRDGSGIKAWQRAAKDVAIITGRSSRAVERRAAELGIRDLFQGIDDKLTIYRSLLQARDLRPEHVCCIGDDIADLPLLADCGLAVAVADGCVEARSVAHWITSAKGGRGAVRETIELILRSQGHWSQILKRYGN